MPACLNFCSPLLLRTGAALTSHPQHCANLFRESEKQELHHYFQHFPGHFMLLSTCQGESVHLGNRLGGLLQMNTEFTAPRVFSHVCFCIPVRGEIACINFQLKNEKLMYVLPSREHFKGCHSVAWLFCYPYEKAEALSCCGKSSGRSPY